MKSYTDLEQSRKLAEFLPIESADMHYGEYSYNFVEYPIPNNESDYECGYNGRPAWSLSALLSILPDYTLQTNTDGTVFVVCDSKKPVISDAYDNPIDACVGMIEKLHNLNLL